MKGPDVHITAGAYLFAAICVLLLPMNWLLGWLIAVVVHEAGHLAVLRFLRIPVHDVKVTPFGARISTGYMTPIQEFLCAGAGPLCSFMLLIQTPILPAATIIGLAQSLFNLLPVYPLDGGRMLRAMLHLIREKLPVRKIPCKE